MGEEDGVSMCLDASAWYLKDTCTSLPSQLAKLLYSKLEPPGLLSHVLIAYDPSYSIA